MAVRRAVCISQRGIVLRKLDITITALFARRVSLLQKKSVFFSFNDVWKVLNSSGIVQFVQHSKQNDPNRHCDVTITELL